MTAQRVYAKDAATMLRRTPSTLAHWRVKSFGPTPHSDGYRIFYLQEDIEAFLDAQLN